MGFRNLEQHLYDCMFELGCCRKVEMHTRVWEGRYPSLFPDPNLFTFPEKDLEAATPPPWIEFLLGLRPYLL